MIALVVFTDGRWDVLRETILSAASNLVGPITRTTLVVDGDHQGDLKNLDEISTLLAAAFPRAINVTMRHRERLGFGGTIETAWRDVRYYPERFVFHLEDDFTFNRFIDLTTMVAVLDAEPNVVQLALRRQPWNDVERTAGGIVECWPDEYVERSHLTVGGGILPPVQPVAWLEHRLFFTTNPSLYRRSLCEIGWPTGESRTEEAFTQQLLADPDLRFAFWGSRDSGEAVRHIGEHRNGTGY